MQFRKNALWGQRRQWAPITLFGLASAQLAIFCSIRFKTYVLNTYYVYCVNWKNLQFSLLLWVFVTFTQLTLLVTKCMGFPPQQVILCRTPAGCSIQFNSIFNPIHLEMVSDRSEKLSLEPDSLELLILSSELYGSPKNTYVKLEQRVLWQKSDVNLELD